MKEKSKKIACSVMPFWIECLYTTGRYNLQQFPALAKVLLMLLPSAFLYTVSNYNSSDKRRIEYWLPYGMMRNDQLKTWGRRIESGYHSVFFRFLRWVFPYGYVLWWDNSTEQLANRSESVSSAGYESDKGNISLAKIEEKLTWLQEESVRNRKNQRELAERIEVGLLKLAIEIKEQKS